MDMENLLDALGDDQVVFATVEAHDRDVTTDIVEAISAEARNIIFLSISKPAMTRKRELEEHGVEDTNVFFIDGSGTMDQQLREDNIVYIDPSNLTELSLVLDQAVKAMTGEGLLVVVLMDALESLAMYSSDQVFRRFLHIFCSKLRHHHVGAVLLSSEGALDSDMRSLITQFVDETMEVEL